MTAFSNDVPHVTHAPLDQVEAIFTDVDGTLTTQGKITADALNALERLARVNIPVVLVSGRPAGWGEAWVRQWPVAGAILENGALHFAWRKGRLVKSYAQPETVRTANRRVLNRLVKAALKEVPGARLSSDSLYTEVDLAIDYAEDARLGAPAADALEAFLRSRGVNAVRSSVHVNCWIGRFDKLSAVRRFVKQEWKKTLQKDEQRYAYVGDSFNDAPMFKAFPLSIGVANVSEVWPMLDAHPKYICSQREGRGFMEIVDVILKTNTEANS